MNSTITCTACGTVLGVPKSGMPKDGLSCNWCGYVNAASTEAAAPPRTASPRPAPTPVAATVAVPEAPPPLPQAAPHRWADDEDDDGQPYIPKPEEIKTRKCAECGKDIDLLAVVCVHCGYDAQAKQKVERVFAPIDRTWESGWPLQRRMAVFLVCQALNLITLIVSGGTPTSWFGVLFAVALQAFVLGSFETLRVRRNKKGQAEVIVTWRVGFVPMAPKKLNWKEHEGIAFGHFDPTGLSDWWIFFVLLPWFIFPAILWWWYVIRADHFFAALARDRGFPETYLYRGTSEPQAKEICQVVTDATGLPLTAKL